MKTPVIETAWEAALAYIKRGWRPIPIPFKKKKATLNGWTNLRLEADDVPEYFSGRSNVGVLLGEPSNWLIDVDLDHPLAVELADVFLPPTGAVFGRASKPRSHRLYHAEGVKSRRFEAAGLGAIAEIRSTGNQTVFPPSIHPSGERIEWEREGEPARVEAHELQRAVSRLAAAVLLAEHWPGEGARQNAAMALGGALLRLGFDADEAKCFIEAVAQAAGDEETAMRVRTVDYTAAKLEADRPTTGWTRLAEIIENKDAVQKAREWLAASIPPERLLVVELSDTERRAHLGVKRFFDGAKFVPPLLAEELLREAYFIYANETLYVYRNGVYVPEGERYVERRALELLGTEFRRNRFEETLFYIERKARLQSWQVVNPDDGLINVKNGLLDWRTGELRPHTPERLSTIQIPVLYDPDARAERIERFFREVMPHDAIPTVEEYVGYILVPNTKYQKAMMLTGKADSGKSTFILLLEAFVGRENMASVPLQELTENRFKRALLEGKLLNAFADISHKAVEDSGYFKAIVTGDAIDAEKKFKPPFVFRPFSKLLFSANELPASRDISEGYFRRWLIIPFAYQGEKDPNLLEKLTVPHELSGLLNVAIGGLRRLERQGRFTENEATRKALEMYRENIDSVAAFVKERVAIDDNAAESKQEIFAAYKRWCDVAGLKPLGRNRFNARFVELTGAREAGHHIVRRWRGVRLLPDATVIESFADDEILQ
ncbi:MAG: bifunctional DNA primase/polymerase [Hydrogenibacillus schlegelii]|uniref:Bifunctional DNA primase/polymerase n=1 Tax=Hydrogenibacillus schlegelii TaxID=1484 RepID=A0A947CX51_HYDSH|nr:bifunctional DNA primase/polymerase [Hydrogenibacillus schlegelii]MBT9282677.1 bifunctional DNA primase/polymerase [Hydrogenibacillus schlegelii]